MRAALRSQRFVSTLNAVCATCLSIVITLPLSYFIYLTFLTFCSANKNWIVLRPDCTSMTPSMQVRHVTSVAVIAAERRNAPSKHYVRVLDDTFTELLSLFLNLFNGIF